MRAGGADIVFDSGTGIFQVRTERCGGRASSADVFLFENTVRGSRLCRPSGNTGIGGGGGLRRCCLLYGKLCGRERIRIKRVGSRRYVRAFQVCGGRFSEE